MGDRSLPPKVDGHAQGRLDLIFGRPAVFPPPQVTQSFIFTFWWWGDSRPCTLRLPPEKSETRITHAVTCSPASFRQYLCDMRNLHVTLKIGGEGRADMSLASRESFEQQTQSPRELEGETPRQKLLRRQLRLKKGWQDGDAVGNFVLPDLKLNARGDYVHEGKILDSSGDLVGSVVVTMVFLEGSLEDFQQIKIQNEDIPSPQATTSPEKKDNGTPRSRSSGIPVLESRSLKFQKTPSQEGSRPRSGSFRESFRRRGDKLKKQQQPQQNHFDLGEVEKENQAPLRRRTGSFTKDGREVSALQENLTIENHIDYQESPLQQFHYAQPDSLTVKNLETVRQESLLARPQDDKESEPRKSPQLPRRATPQKVHQKGSEAVKDATPVVRREKKTLERGCDRARPASWGLYPLLDGADPHSLVDSGAVKAEDLPVLLQVLEGRSPNLDLSNFDYKTQKFLDGLDLSLTPSGFSGSSPGKFFNACNSNTENIQSTNHAFSVFNKGTKKVEDDASGVALSGVWPLEEGNRGEHIERYNQHPSIAAVDKSITSNIIKFESPRKSQAVQTRIPTSQGGKNLGKVQRSLSLRAAPDERLTDSHATPREGQEAWSKGDKTIPEKYASEEGSVLVVDVGTLTLSPPLLPPKPPEQKEKVTGVRVWHRSRVCYLTSLDVSLPGVDPPSEWELSQTCASRQLLDHEVHYNVREVLKLPPLPAAQILQGHLIIKCVCRRLGERDSEEVGSSSISLLDLWQMSGTKVQVPLFSQHPTGSLTRRQGRKARKKEDEDKPQSFAQLTFTACLALSSGRGEERGHGTKNVESRLKPESRTHSCNGEIEEAPSVSREESFHSRKFMEGRNLLSALDSSSGSDLSDTNFPTTEPKQSSQYHLKPKVFTPYCQEHTQSSDFNSIHMPTHMSPNDKVRRNIVQHPRNQGATGAGEGMLGHPYNPSVTPSTEPGYQGYHGSFLSAISEYNGSNNQPVESGGESPCITTSTDFCTDFINYDTLGWRPSIEARREEHTGCCRVHLEILKGRNLPWLGGADGVPQPPSCYVRTTVGSVTILTNVCQESVNPMWNFAADVLLPYSQLAQTNGSLILKVHHSRAQQRTTPGDLLLGFVSVDATSIWSGHVSLCGWYPLLDLRGAVRGHVKVSLTPHEPPLSVAVNSVRQTFQPLHQPTYGPPVSQHLSRHSYPQGVIHTEARYSPGDSVHSSVLGSLPRSASSLPQFTSKNQREMYNQNLQGVKNPASLDFNGLSLAKVPKSSCHSGLAGSDEKSDDSSNGKEASQKFTRVNLGEKTQNCSRKSSCIPVFASNKNVLKSPRQDDKSKIHSNLPKVEYKDQNSVYPSTEVFSQGYCRHRGSIIVKGLATETSQDPQHSDTELKVSSSVASTHQKPLEKETGKESTVIKDSLIVSHFRMQNNKDEGEGESEALLGNKIVLGGKPEVTQRGIMSGSSSDTSQSDSQHSAPDLRSSSQSSNKPSSCLKAPGSPSLRAKHVTFAHKLVQHQNGEGTLSSHHSQGEVSWRPHQFSRSAQPSKQELVSPRDLRASHPTTAESSDLQVVPCREGDMQPQTTAVSAQGGTSVNGYGPSIPHDRAKEDLIMAFSWMNQTSGCDTPCVSFIESKNTMQNSKESSSTCSSNAKSSCNERMGAPCPSDSTSPKKSRKLRSRIAANFTLK